MANPVSRPTSGVQDANGNLKPDWVSWLNWIDQLAGAMRQSGPTADRPTKGLWIGRQYYDTTLNYPVWVDSVGPVVWKNAAGTTV